MTRKGWTIFALVNLAAILAVYLFIRIPSDLDFRARCAGMGGNWYPTLTGGACSFRRKSAP